MNRLFGVTMAERGVSQLVSVDLEDAVKILDQNVAYGASSPSPGGAGRICDASRTA